MLSDAEFYKKEQERKDRHNYAIKKGMIADAWFNAGNKLTKETMKENGGLLM